MFVEYHYSVLVFRVSLYVSGRRHKKTEEKEEVGGTVRTGWRVVKGNNFMDDLVNDTDNAR